MTQPRPRAVFWFRVVFAGLFLNFTIPALLYTFAPQVALDQFMQVNAILGGIDYPFAEEQSRVWRYLAAANVMTLGFMCGLLWYDVRRFYVVLVPLTFMKGYAATCWLFGWLAYPGVMLFLAGAVLDFVTCWAFVFFARRAHRALSA